MVYVPPRDQLFPDSYYSEENPIVVVKTTRKKTTRKPTTPTTTKRTTQKTTRKPTTKKPPQKTIPKLTTKRTTQKTTRKPTTKSTTPKKLTSKEAIKLTPPGPPPRNAVIQAAAAAPSAAPAEAPRAAAFPMLLMAIVGSIQHEKLSEMRTMISKENCGLLCKYTAECRGMVYTNSNQQCQLIKFDEYNFSGAKKSPDEQYYLRQYAPSTDKEFHFDSVCPENETTITDYMYRLRLFHVMQCPDDVTNLKWKTFDGPAVDEDFYPLIENKLKPSCDGAQYRCYHGCPEDKYLVIAHGWPTEYKFMKNFVNWPAMCYNGRWAYFDPTTQQVIPVGGWACADKVSCPSGYVFAFKKCWKNFNESNHGVTWEQANKTCTLATIDSQEEWDYVTGNLFGANIFGGIAVGFMRNASGIYTLDNEKLAKDHFIFSLDIGYSRETANYASIYSNETKLWFQDKTETYIRGLLCTAPYTLVPRERPPADYALFEEMVAPNYPLPQP